VVDAHAVGEANRFHDLLGAVSAGGARIQEIRVRTDARDRQPVVLEPLFHVGRVVVETDRCGELELPAQQTSRVVVRYIGILEPHVGNPLQLVIERFERVDERETADFHARGEFECLGNRN
jgi:hypothetical protein